MQINVTLNELKEIQARLQVIQETIPKLDCNILADSLLFEAFKLEVNSYKIKMTPEKPSLKLVT